MARQVENLPNPPPDTLGLPDAILLRPTITAIFDSVKDEIILITPIWVDKSLSERGGNDLCAAFSICGAFSLAL